MAVILPSKFFIMSYYSENELFNMGFKHIGNNVKISTKASIYNYEKIEIDDNSRIDDFCLLSGKITIGKYVHIAPFCNLAGGEKGIFIEDFVGIAYGNHIFTQTDDYSGEAMTSPLIPAKFTKVMKKKVWIKKYSIIGTNSITMPGVTIEIGTAIGLKSVVYGKTKEWSIYSGNPAIKIGDRSKRLLDKVKIFYSEHLGPFE
jgi:acetyltransferase-like isoleucine patch superfamily enzyme